MPSIPGIDKSHNTTSVAVAELDQRLFTRARGLDLAPPFVGHRMASERHMFGSSSTTSTRGRAGAHVACDIINATAGCPS